MNLLKYILGILLLITTNVMADPLDQFVSSIDEQIEVSKWVRSNAQIDITESKALSLVKDIYAYALSSNLNPLLLVALIRAESGFNHKAKSNHNALGLTQVIKKYHLSKIKNRNLFNQKVAIEVGSLVLKDCFDKHKQNVYKSLNCYSGNGGKKYYKKVTSFQTNLKNHLMYSNINQLAFN